MNSGASSLSKKEQARMSKTTSAKATAASAAASTTTNTTSNNNNSAISIGTKPTFVEVKNMKFLIMDAPRQANLHAYIREMSRHHVTDVCRFCEPTYNGTTELKAAGITLHDMEYQDGTSPSPELIDRWLKLVHETFPTKVDPSNTTEPPAIAVHCVAGLGRAPVMVAIALVEFANMDPVEAVLLLRKKRRGAINERQLQYLEAYQKRFRRGGGGAAATGGCCVIS